MKKNIFVSLILGLSLFTHSGCDDNKDEYLSDFSTILYFRNSGEVPLTLYKTGESTDYTIVVNKAGSNLSATSVVSVGLMSDASLAIYNTENGTKYKKFPGNCFTFQETKVEFASSETYKNLGLKLNTNEIEKVVNSLETYVVPLEMFDSADSINSKKRMIFVSPTVIVPRISFDKTGYQLNTVSDAGAAQIKLSLPMTLPLVNKWTFNCTVGIDESLLNEYNLENDVNYALLPTNAYTTNQGGIVPFTPGSATGNLDVLVTRAQLQYGNYVLPLRLTACSHPTFLINEAKNTCLFGISYVPDESKLSKVPLTTSMVSIYPDPTNEGSIAEMLDGKPDTYYHSNWGVGLALPHYLQFKLTKECTAFVFEYQTRHNNNNGAPQKITLYGSMDGSRFEKITSISENLPTKTSEKYKSPVMVGKPFKFLRFSVEKTPNGGSFALAEFALYTN